MNAPDRIWISPLNDLEAHKGEEPPDWQHGVWYPHDTTSVNNSALPYVPDTDSVMRADLKPLLQEVGDTMADVLEQMIKGRWTDEHGHSVQNKPGIAQLAIRLRAMANFRTKYLEYSALEDTK